MKKIIILLTGILLISVATISAQEEFTPKNIVKLNGNYILHWFAGSSVSLIGVGPEVEISLNEKTSMGFSLYYMTRIGEPTKKPVIYTDVIYFKWSGRWYSEQVLNGLYGGVLIGIGMPTDNALTADLGVQGGYQIADGRFSFEFGCEAGYGVLRDKSYYGGEPIYDAVWGFYLRPFVSIGYGF